MDNRKRRRRLRISVLTDQVLAGLLPYREFHGKTKTINGSDRLRAAVDALDKLGKGWDPAT